MDSWPLAWLALAIAWADEFAQLIQWPWLAALRKTTPGHLILGSGFDWVDLIAYAVGIAVAATIDQLLREGAVRLRSPKNERRPSIRANDCRARQTCIHAWP
ncbi:DUF2809 domain-containing protein [Massilia sp. H-1]|nr:DUF2809 domain-containing protein [Massilia sp. H-1]